MIPDAVRLQHILDAIGKIEIYGKRDRQDSAIFDAIIRQLSVIGEAVRHLSPALRSAHADIPWKSIVGLRNLVIHEYFIVSTQRIWQIVDQDIPLFQPRIRAILNTLT